MSATPIEWTDTTWNPIRGCSRTSPGCGGPKGVGGCYAEKIAARFSGPGQPFEGYATPRGWTGKLGLIPEKLGEPLRWRKPRRVFVNSMSDLFHEGLLVDEIAQVFGVMAYARRHTFQVLTKRAGQMRAWLSDDRFALSVFDYYTACGDLTGDCPPWEWPLPNVWLGVSAEDQQRFDERLPDLEETPAAVRFLSLEPLLGPIDFRDRPLDPESTMGPWSRLDLGRIHWVIVGGESGPGARPCDVAWIRSIVQQCREAGVPAFVKQMGRWVLGDHEGFECVQRWLFEGGRVFVPPIIGPRAWERPEGAIGFSLTDAKGGDPEDWPEDLRVREMPA